MLARRRAATCTPTTPTTAPCTSGTSGTASTTPPTATHVPRFVRGVRLPGAAGLVDPDPRRARRRRSRPGLTRRCCCTRRPRTATPSSTAASSRTSRVPDDFDDWHWADASCNQARAVAVRRRALPLAGAPRLHRHDRLAAQRLLAGDLLGRGRRRRAAQAAVVRAAARLRRPAAHRAAAATATPGRRGASTTPTSRGRATLPRAARAARRHGARLGAVASPSRPGRCTSPRCRATCACPATRHPRCSSSTSVAGAAVHTWVEDVDLALDPAPARRGRWPPSQVATGSTSRRAASRKDVTLLVDRVDPDAVVDAALVDPAGRRVRHVPRAHRGRRRRGSARAGHRCCAAPTTWWCGGRSGLRSGRDQPQPQ